MSPSLSDHHAGRGALTVNEATREDRHHLKDVLARSFWDDPVISWLLPKEDSRYARSRLFFRTDLGYVSRNGKVLTTPDHAGAALWLPPRKWKMPTKELVRTSPNFVRAFRTGIPGALQFNVLMEKIHPQEPHWYLAVLGTDPLRQGRGVGGALISTITDRADRDLVGCYLESSKPENVPYYERFGFKVTGEHRMEDSPPIWGMWRDPRAS